MDTSRPSSRTNRTRLVEKAIRNADRDEDFATVLGNLVFAGDDHGTGTALMPHQAAPDTTAPVVQWMHPADGSTGLLLSSRIGLSFSDTIDAASTIALFEQIE